MIWRLRDLPELGHLSPADRRRLLHNAAGRWAEAKFVFQAALRGLALTIVLFIVLGIFLEWTMPAVTSQSSVGQTVFSQWMPPAGFFTLLASVWVVLSVGAYQTLMLQVRGQLRIALLEHLKQGGELPVCLRCGYGFQPPVPATCPECGAATG